MARRYFHFQLARVLVRQSGKPRQCLIFVRPRRGVAGIVGVQGLGGLVAAKGATLRPVQR